VLVGDKVVVGVDFGSSRIKAGAYRRDGSLAALADAVTPITSGPDGDDFLVDEMLDAATTAIARLECASGSIVGIGLSSMGEVGTILTEDGLADVAFPSWYDRRGEEVMHVLEQERSAAELMLLTGKHARVTSTVAKLGYLAGHRRGLPEGIFLGLCGALAWKLTDVPWQEAGLAVTSGVFDPVRGEYLHDVWGAGGLGHIELPLVMPAGHSEPASTELSALLSIADGAPVVIAGHDHPVASVGAGIRADELGDSMGTGEALIAVVQADRRDEASRSAALLRDPHLTFEVWPTTGELLAVWERMRPGLAMRAFLDQSGLDRDELDAAAPRPNKFSRMTEAASLALESGEIADVEPSAASWAELIDYYVLLANRGQEIVRAATGITGGTVLTGGGLRSRRWRHSKAMLGRAPMEVSTVQETVTRGCAAMAGVAAGWWPTAEAMPGAERVTVRASSVSDIDAAAARMSW
jgi:sugar (pentulose or hexulose) kinase